MPKKIMVICGSPRPKGNTNTVADWFIEAARSAGAEVEKINAAAMKYEGNGCTSCGGCQKIEEYRCVIDDEATPVLARMPQADVLVFASPVYFFGPTAQIKPILDRTYSLFKFDPNTGKATSPLRGKRIVLIATGAADKEGGLNLLEETFKTATEFMRCELDTLLVPLAPADPKEMAGRQDVRLQAVELGRKLASG